MEEKKRKKYDAIVIGGGHNGLVSSILLAEHGLNVLVVESSSRAGGMASTAELWKGYKAPLGAYVLSLFNQRLMERLGIKKKIELIPKNPGMTVFLENNRILSIYNDAKKTSREISRFSKHDGESYTKWSYFWNSVSLVIEALYSSPPMDIGEIIDILRKIQGIPFIGEKAKRFIEDLIWSFTASASRFLDEFFEAPETKAALIEDALVGELVSPSTPGTALILVHHYFGNVTGNRGQWAYVKGGIGKLSEALLEKAKSLGVEVRFNSPAKQIVIEDGVAKGIITEKGFFEANTIVSTINVKKLFQELIAKEHLERNFLKKIDSIRTIGASYKMLVARRGLPKLKNEFEDYKQMVFSSSAIVMPTISYAEKAYAEALTTGISSEPWMSINVQSYVDSTVAPEGHHLISIFAQYVKSDARRWSKEDKEVLEKNTMDVLSNYFEDFVERKEKTMVLSPLDFEELFNNPGGNIFQLNMIPEQTYTFRPLYECHDYTTPIRNLYIAGSSAHPGGGVTGLPGYLGAMRVLRDRKILSINKEKPLVEVIKEIVLSLF